MIGQARKSRSGTPEAVAWAGLRATADAALSPSSQGGVSGSSASRSPARQGAPPGIPGGGLARPGEKPGSVRTHLRRRSPRGSPQGPAGAEVAGPGTKSAARGVRRNSPDGGADLPILPLRAKPPARAGEDAPRAALSSFEGRA